MDATIAALEAQGATIVDPADIPFGAWADAEFPALLCEFKTDIATLSGDVHGPRLPEDAPGPDRLQQRPSRARVRRPGVQLELAVFDLAQETGGRDADCAAPRAIATPGAQAAIDDLWRRRPRRDHRADERPRLGHDPVNGDLGGDFSTFIGSSGPPAVAGYANVTVPAGFVGPLPVDVSFIGGRWSEPTLIGFAYDFEQATHVRVPPQFIPSIGDGASAARQPSSHERQKASIPGRNGNWKTPLR